MALVPLTLLLDHAAENGYGIPAFNVNNLEQVQSIMEAAYETDSPVILQASRGARSYAGEIFLRHLIIAAVETDKVVLDIKASQSGVVAEVLVEVGDTVKEMQPLYSLED